MFNFTTVVFDGTSPPFMLCYVMLCYVVVFSSMKIEREQHLGLPYSSLRVTESLNIAATERSADCHVSVIMMFKFCSHSWKCNIWLENAVLKIF